MEEFNNNSDGHREDELFESDSDFRLNLSLRSNFRVITRNPTTSSSPQDLPAEATTATNQETMLATQASEIQPKPCTNEKNSEKEKDEIILNLTRKLAEKNTQLMQANEQISNLKRESETVKVRLEKAEENASDLKKELKDKKGQLVNLVLAKERANKVEKFLTTVTGELGTFVRKLRSMIVLNPLQMKSKYLLLGPFQTCDVKNEFIKLVNELATNITTNSATVEVVRDFLVIINTALIRQVNLAPVIVSQSSRSDNVTPEIIECTPENLTSNPTSNENVRQEQSSTKRVCRGIRQATHSTTSSTYIPNSHLLINPPPLVPTTRAAPSSSTHKQSTFQSIRATPSSGNHAQYTLQITETTSMSSFANAQSSSTRPTQMIPPNWDATSSSSTHTQYHSSTYAQSPSSIYPQPLISHTRDATSYPVTHSQPLIPPTRTPLSPLTIRDARSFPPIQVISLISPTRATTPTSSTNSQSMTSPVSSLPSISPSHVHPRIAHTVTESSSIPKQSMIPPSRAIPSSSSTYAQSLISPDCASSSFSSTPAQSIAPLTQAEPSFPSCSQQMIPCLQVASSSYFTTQGISVISSHQTESSSFPTHPVLPPLQPLEVNSLTPLNHNSGSPSSSSGSTPYADYGLDLTSDDTETKHGINESFQLAHVCLCGGTFRTRATLKMHIQNLTTEGNFECDICKRRFHYPSVVKEHMMSAHKVARRLNGQRVFICYICQKDDLGSWEEFQEHLYTIHLRTPHRRY